MENAVKLSDKQWKEQLTLMQYYVLREKGTEPAFSGELTDHFEPGTYHCAGCGAELFKSITKFHSGCGWPAFYAVAAGNRVRYHRDTSFGMVRTEVTCANCDGHLGHLFDDAPDQPIGQRYCINSVAIRFVPGRPSSSKSD